MILHAYTVMDTKAQVYLAPFFLRSAGEAIRQFTDLVNSDHPIGRHPADYNLFSIGSFNDQTGGFEEGIQTMLGNGLDYLQVAEGDLFTTSKLKEA